jgi:hypothetical protein
MIIPDAHSYPGDSMERFHMAGEFALKMRPDVIIEMGDWEDMESLCKYDEGLKTFEGRRYHLDTQASRDAREAFNKPIETYNRRQAKNKKHQYKPRKVALLGNHTNRINKAIQRDPKLEGTLGVEDLGANQYGWETHDFLKAVQINGIYYNHYFISGVMGYPIGGENPARTICKKHMSSCTAAHTHVFDTSNQTAPNGKTAYGLVAGCYFEHNMEYAGATQHMWWRGLFLKHNVCDGEYDLETWSIERLRGGF